MHRNTPTQTPHSFSTLFRRHAQLSFLRLENKKRLSICKNNLKPITVLYVPPSLLLYSSSPMSFSLLIISSDKTLPFDFLADQDTLVFFIAVLPPMREER
jgi:hypothetical protein